jgi:O-antigen/teichoic acid export membrane protein
LLTQPWISPFEEMRSAAKEPPPSAITSAAIATNMAGLGRATLSFFIVLQRLGTGICGAALRTLRASTCPRNKARHQLRCGRGACAAVTGDLLGAPAAASIAARGGALRLAGYAVSVGMSVVAAALLFRHLGVGGAGRYVTALAVVAIFGALADAGIAPVATRELALHSAEERRTLLRPFLGFRIVSTTTGLVAAVAFAAAVGYSAELVAGIAVAGTGLLVQHVQTTMSTPLIAELRFGWITFLELLRQAISVVLIVVFVTADAGLVPLLAVSIPAAAATLAITAWLVHGRVSLRPDLRPAAWLPLLRQILPLAGASAVTAVHFRIPVVLMSLTVGRLQTGYFAASFRVVDVLVAVPQMLFGAAFPIMARAARDDQARLQRAVGRMLDLATIVGAGIALVLVVGAPAVIEVVAGPRFGPAIDVLRIHAAAFAVACISTVLVYALVSLGAYRDVLMANLVALSVSVIATVPAARAFGAEGAAAAAVATEAALAAAAGWALLRRQPGLRLRPRGLWRLAAALAVAAAASAIPPGLPSWARAALSALIFVAVLAALRGFPPELRQFFAGRRPHARGEP